MRPLRDRPWTRQESDERCLIAHALLRGSQACKTFIAVVAPSVAVVNLSGDGHEVPQKLYETPVRPNSSELATSWRTTAVYV